MLQKPASGKILKILANSLGQFWGSSLKFLKILENSPGSFDNLEQIVLRLGLTGLKRKVICNVKGRLLK